MTFEVGGAGIARRYRIGEGERLGAAAKVCRRAVAQRQRRALPELLTCENAANSKTRSNHVDNQ